MTHIHTGQGTVTAPGCIAAIPIEAPLDITDGCGTLDMPLVYFYGHASAGDNPELYKVCFFTCVCVCMILCVHGCVNVLAFAQICSRQACIFNFQAVLVRPRCTVPPQRQVNNDTDLVGAL